MNSLQHERLFADITSAQAEMTAGGALPIKFVSVSAPYGKATALFQRLNPAVFSSETLYVKDALADGYPVYAQFQGQQSDGSILTLGGKWFDRKGAAAREGTFHHHINVFNRSIRKLRLVILRDNPGRNLFVAGDWVDF